MAPRSPVSSEPLSSSSLSPPPQQRRTVSSKAVKGPAKTAMAEDSSDLSELSDEDENDTMRQRAQPTSATKRTRRRGALIPEDMWDWAYKKKPTSSRSVSAHHRDEDDEEGEEESDGDDDNEEDHDGREEEEEEEEEEERGSPPAQSAPATHPSSSQAAAVANARASPTALAPSRRGRSPVPSDRAPRGMPVIASEEEEEEEDVREEGEIDEHSDTEQQRTTATSPTSRNKPTNTPKRARIRNEDDDDDIGAGPPHDAPPPDDGTEDEEEGHLLITARTKRDLSSAPITPLTNDHGDGDDDEDDGQSSAASDDASIDIEWATQIKPSRPHPEWDDSPDFSFLPRRHATARTRLLARHAALVAGEDAEEPDVQDELRTTRKLAHDDATALTLVGATLALTEASPTSKADPDADATPPDDAEPVTAAPDEDAEVEVEVEVEGEVEAVSEDEEDEEAEDALEVDTELQPPQRAEALDILAGMEVKFAILRERIYIDKMEEIAAEEAMILNGTHPELLHFLATLSQRKERRTKLASLRRDRDKEWIHKKRKADEDGIWSWWRVQKDGLRDDMVAEVNGKRRKLEREKRSLDNRVNVRNPFIPADISLPGFQSIKQILKSHQRPSLSTELSTNVTLPSLPPLAELEVAADLEGISNGRRSNHQRLYQQTQYQEQQRQQQHHASILPQMTYHNLEPLAAMGGEYGIIDGSQYANLVPVNHHHALPPPPAPAILVPNAVQHRHSQTTLPSVANLRNVHQPPPTHSHAHDSYHIPPSAPTPQRTYPPSSTQFPQQSQQSNQVHTAAIVSRKRSTSPNRVPSSTAAGTTQMNGWDDVAPGYQAHRRSKTSRVDQLPVMEAHGSGAGDDWGPAVGVSDHARRNQLPPARNSHRGPVPSIDHYYEPGHTGMQDRPPSRIPAPDYGSERQYLPGPAALVSEAGLPPLELAGPLPNSGAYWHGASGGNRRERERERERDRERDRRDEQMFQAHSYGLPPSRPSSQPQTTSNRPPSPSHYRTLPPPPTGSNSRRTPLPPTATNLLPPSPALSHTSSSKKPGGSMSPIHNRLPPPASRGASPPPRPPSSSILAQPRPKNSISMPNAPHTGASTHTNNNVNSLPTFPLPPILAGSSGPGSYSNGLGSMIFGGPSSAPSSASPTPLPPSSSATSNGGIGPGLSTGSKPSRPSAVPVE